MFKIIRIVFEPLYKWIFLHPLLILLLPKVCYHGNRSNSDRGVTVYNVFKSFAVKYGDIMFTI